MAKDRSQPLPSGHFSLSDILVLLCSYNNIFSIILLRFKSDFLEQIISFKGSVTKVPVISRPSNFEKCVRKKWKTILKSWTAQLEHKIKWTNETINDYSLATKCVSGVNLALLKVHIWGESILNSQGTNFYNSKTWEPPKRAKTFLLKNGDQQLCVNVPARFLWSDVEKLPQPVPLDLGRAHLPTLGRGRADIGKAHNSCWPPGRDTLQN